MRRLQWRLGRLGLLSVLLFSGLLFSGLLALLSGAALAAPYTVLLDTQKSRVEGTLDGGDLYLQLLPFLQALGGGARPVKFDLTAATIVLTRGDGSKTVAAAFRILGDGPNKQPYVAALSAARGLGLQATLSGSTLTLSSQSAAPPPRNPLPTNPAAPVGLYPQGLSGDGFETVARALLDELSSQSSSSSVLETVLNNSGLPVYGTAQRPADGDVLEIYQALHHPFATVLELYTLRIGFQYRTFTPIDAYLSGLSDRGLAGPKLTAGTLPGVVSAALYGGPPSRSQVVLALVGAIGRERARRGVTVSSRRDPFWGDDLLDPVQLRLLSAVLETGTGPDNLAARHADAGPRWPGSRRPWTQLPEARPSFSLTGGPLMVKFRPPASPPLLAYAGGSDALVPKGVTDFFSKVADKAVKEIVKETYPDAAKWLDNSVQDALGIPIALPISPALLEDVLKGDVVGMKASWAGLLQTASVETAKEGARAVFCGSIVLYGYHSKIEANPAVIHRRTNGDEAGTSLSKMTATLTYDGDYRDHVFKDSVRYISSLALKKPLTTVGELLERLGCELPKDDPQNGVTPVGGKTLDWEVTGEIAGQLNGSKPEFADPVTDASGVAHAQWRALDEQTPKAFRALSSAATGNIFLNFKGLIPEKWWRVLQATQYGQDTAADTKNTGKAGSSTQRLTVQYFKPPDLTLKFHSVVVGTGPNVNYKLELDASVHLKELWSGEPNAEGSRFLGYAGEDTLRYEGHNFSSSCGAKISGVKNGVLSVKVVADTPGGTGLTLALNPGLASRTLPVETVVVPAGAGPNCDPGGGQAGYGLWAGSWLGAYGTGDHNLIGTLPDNSAFGVIVHQDKQAGPYLMHKTLTGKVDAHDAVVTDTTEVTLVVGGQKP
ncbi:hypothetical protein [Deinococcus altitudinis]|uniref:hypothetical protein n=1 Tax=Deinococcus altitudinis TaxID=468914 RepID=UPI0038926B16